MSLLVLLVSPYTIWYDTGKSNELNQKKWSCSVQRLGRQSILPVSSCHVNL